MNTKLNQILAEISAGELLDKITILQIKKEKINDKEKLKNIDKELSSLTTTSNEKIPDKSKVMDLIESLKKINLNNKNHQIERLVRACFFPPNEPAFFINRGKKFYIIPKEQLKKIKTV